MNKLVKSFDDKVISGVCGGVARYLNIDSTVIRIIFALGTILGGGTPILIYCAMALIMPSDMSSPRW